VGSGRTARRRGHRRPWAAMEAGGGRVGEVIGSECWGENE
jgi:hypothetical protein